jgi:hypothetical protein
VAVIGAPVQRARSGLVAHLVCKGGLIDAINSGRSTARMGMQPSPVEARAAKD